MVYIYLNNSGATLKSVPTVFLIDSIKLFFVFFSWSVFLFYFQYTNSILEHSSRLCQDKARRAIILPNLSWQRG